MRWGWECRRGPRLGRGTRLKLGRKGCLLSGGMGRKGERGEGKGVRKGHGSHTTHHRPATTNRQGGHANTPVLGQGSSRSIIRASRARSIDRKPPRATTVWGRGQPRAESRQCGGRVEPANRTWGRVVATMGIRGQHDLGPSHPPKSTSRAPRRTGLCGLAEASSLVHAPPAPAGHIFRPPMTMETMACVMRGPEGRSIDRSKSIGQSKSSQHVKLPLMDEGCCVRCRVTLFDRSTSHS